MNEKPSGEVIDFEEAKKRKLRQEVDSDFGSPEERNENAMKGRATAFTAEEVDRALGQAGLKEPGRTEENSAQAEVEKYGSLEERGAAAEQMKATAFSKEEVDRALGQARSKVDSIPTADQNNEKTVSFRSGDTTVVDRGPKKNLLDRLKFWKK